MEKYRDNKNLLGLVEKKKYEMKKFLQETEDNLILNKKKLRYCDAIKYNTPFPLVDCNENILILNNKQKCEICNNISYFKINSKTFCWNHFWNSQKEKNNIKKSKYIYNVRK